jgi:crotonobetainyl-CoA:carnitine CoA-transferase CaiB-like acyl-CoA transferase
MTQPLAGAKVLEFSEHGFVPSAAAVLADWGADVVKIERPHGDPMRRVISDGLMPDAGGFDYLFELVNRNKRGIALDVTVAGGREVFERLVRWADVYVTNQLPRVRRKLRTEPDDLFALNPRLVFAKGHGQGQRGPDAEAGGFDFVSFWARGGVGYLLTDPDATTPTHQRGAMGDVPTGGWFAGGICAAMVQVLRTGKGVVVDTSLLNGAAWVLGPDLAYTSATGKEAARGTPPPHMMSPLACPYRTSDERWVYLAMVEWEPYWPRLCRALDLEHLVGRYTLEKTEDGAVWAAVNAELARAIGSLTYAELEERFRAERCIYAPLHTPHEVLADPAVTENGYLMRHPEHPTARIAAAPAQFDDELPSIRRAAPALGEHTREILTELGYAPAEIQALFDRQVVSAVSRP